MKSSVRVGSFDVMEGVFGPLQADYIFKRLDELEVGYWERRTRMHPARSINGAGCSYWFASHNSLPQDLVEYLRALAPSLAEGICLDEICVNKYDPGDHIGLHKDSGHAKNMVVSLVDDDENGCIADGELFVDVKGRAMIHPSRSTPHSVPPCTKTRYVVIYLYHYGIGNFS